MHMPQRHVPEQTSTGIVFAKWPLTAQRFVAAVGKLCSGGSTRGPSSHLAKPGDAGGAYNLDGLSPRSDLADHDYQRPEKSWHIEPGTVW